MRKKLMVLVLILTLIMSTVPSYAVIVQDSSGKSVEVDTFDDMTNHWAKDVANSWKYYEIIEGVKEGKAENFKPNNNITRRDFAVILNRLFDYNSTSVNSFRDLENDAYYTSAVLALNAEEIMKGSDGYFRPHAYITREEAAVTMARAFKLKEDGGSTGFYDNRLISDWAMGYVSEMSDRGYITGYNGSFNPKGYITRAQAIQLVDNLIKGYYNTSASGGAGFTNEFSGNGFMNGGAVKLNWTNIDGDFYIANGASGALTLTNTEIDGNIIDMADKSTITLDADSEVDTIYIYGDRSTITANDNVNYIEYYGTGHILKSVPDHVRLHGGASVTVDGVLFENTKSRTVSYGQDDIELKVAAENGKLTGGPEVETGDVTASSTTNTITATGNELKDKGDSEIEEIGILINSGTDEAPTYDDYDIKVKFKGDADDLDEFTVKYEGAAKDTEYIVRAYAVNESDKAGYGEAVSVVTYDVAATMAVTNTTTKTGSNGMITAVVKNVQVLLYGDSIPEISKVTVLGNTNNGIEEDINSYSAKLSTTVNSGNTKKYSYIATITYPVDSSGNSDLDGYYGYKVEFKDGGVMRDFPVITDSATVPSDVGTVSTGSVKYNNGTVAVSDSSFVEGTGAIVETGIAILARDKGLAAPTSVTSAWQKYTDFDGTNSMDTTFSKSITVNDTANTRYYVAAYVKTTARYTFGEIKSVLGKSAPVINGVTSTNVSSSGTSAMVTLNVESYNPLKQAIVGSVIIVTKDGDEVYQYTDATLDYLGANFDMNTNSLKLYFKDLEPGSDYEVQLRVHNSYDWSNTITFDIAT